jgi:hypothetical protein
MPPLNPVPNGLRVFLKGFIDTEDIYQWGNVLHFLYSGTAPTSAVCSTIAGNIAAEWNTHMGPECPSPTSLTEVTVTDLTSPTSGGGLWVGANTGSRGDDSIPANAAGLVTYPVTTYRYRGGHPRSYLYVGGNADLEGAGKWSSAFTLEYVTHWQAFLNGCLASGASGTVISELVAVRYIGIVGGIPNQRLSPPIVLPLVVADCFASQEIASQRRRVGRRK